MTSQTSVNISSGEANRSGTDIQGPLLPQDRNQPEMDIVEDLRMKIQALEERNLELTRQYNQDMSYYKKELMKLRLQLERGEALRRVLESEMSLARKDAQVQMYSAEDELCDAKAKLLELQARSSEPRQHTVTYGSEESIWFSFPHEENVTPRGRAPDVCWGPSRHRYSPYPRPAITSGGTLYVTCPTPGTDTTSESVPSYFIPRGISTPLRPDVPASWSDDVIPSSWRNLSDEVFTPARPISDEVFTPGRPISDEVFTPGRPISDEVFTPGRPISDGVFIPGTQLSDEVFTPGRPISDEVFTPGRPISDEVFTPGRPISDEVFTPGGRELSDKVFTSGSRSEFDWNYSRHFGPLRPLANRTADRMYYTRSDSDLHSDSVWVYRQPSVIRIPIPCGRSSKAYSFRRPITSMYVQVSPTGIGSTSWVDDSSRIRPLSTFTMSTPSWERIRAPVGAPVHPPAPVNAPFVVTRRRARSLPPFRSASRGISPNTRRLHEI
ncbi:uncharacterized protein LOC130264651 [Oenanthe melanoleuca]|uniref:uncharacterized protein LOC130264651 n=1 Tax=Oenanthe melanoleuca TaxID=2939378 RepID=UPI0024C19163|nr:uncharacterized protein LOC130264651 [Oenanthe melanoleuca]